MKALRVEQPKTVKQHKFSEGRKCSMLRQLVAQPLGWLVLRSFLQRCRRPPPLPPLGKAEGGLGSPCVGARVSRVG